MSDSIAYDLGDRVRFRTGNAVWTVEDVGGPNLDRVLCRSERGHTRWVDAARIRPVETTDAEPSASTGPRVEFDRHGRCTVDGQVVRAADPHHSTTVEWEVPSGDATWSDPSAVTAYVQLDWKRRPWLYLAVSGGVDVYPNLDHEHDGSRETRPWPWKEGALGKRAAIELAGELLRLSTYLDD